MDRDRQVRFWVAPLLFLAFVGWSEWLDGKFPEILGSQDAAAKEVSVAIKLLVTGGTVLFSSGIIIGTTTYVVLRIIGSWLNRNGHHEAVIKTDDSRKLIWARLWGDVDSEKKPDADRSKDFYAVVAFDHGILSRLNPGVHRWVVRRWNGFYMNANCFVALLFAGVVVLFFLHIYPPLGWWLLFLISGVSFFLNAWWSWKDVMGMIAFQAPSKPMPKVRGQRKPPATA
jgi:hypothetical protein